MLRLQAYKYEILPNGGQQRRMRRCAGSCRFVFNKALALQKERYERGEKKLSYAGLCKLLTQWRNGTETPWLANAPTHPLQQALKDLERAYQNFFARRAHFPRFKRKGSVPQQPGDAGRGKEHHRKPLLRPVVRQRSDRTRSREARPE